MLYLYAVTEARSAAATARHGVLGAVTGDPLPAGEESLWHHEAVVEDAMAHGPVLPMRFGSVVADPEEFLAARHDELAAALERVRGAVELGVRVLAGEPVGAPASGTEYLLRRAAAHLGDAVHAPLAELARHSLRRTSTAAYLVDRELVDAFRARVDAFARDDLVCTGPWPPYSFVA